MMTRKDYQAFAEILNLKYKSYSDSSGTPYYNGKMDALREIIDDIKVVFLRDNANFNPSRFDNVIFKK